MDDGCGEAQRKPVTFGDGAARPALPLLVIAGAGWGKTRTLAHRVAHLLAQGADPSRILLMTFSRRAARELTSRVESLVARIDGIALPAGALTWAGTFHAVGTRLLRDYALSIGLDPDFSIHERDLTQTTSRFPAKGTCLAIYSR